MASRLIYYLADGVYFNLALFVKKNKERQTRIEKTYASAEKSLRKDFERVFGVLLARFHVLEISSRLWYKDGIATFLKSCIIMHNMILESIVNTYERNMFSLQYSEEARVFLKDGNHFNGT